ncbi:unnamed protein product [Tuwongella immobilis]|uniref:Uncharacterized protein n=1 Tax=Tuwongella immobilis TaxID=692036 RepID=A0A6C2YTM7_9BACT|nr:unnamed protein product [Tuwongella immobilis]VTS06308.1 unnamed protein product [Tuwongella immobilis]
MESACWDDGNRQNRASREAVRIPPEGICKNGLLRLHAGLHPFRALAIWRTPFMLSTILTTNRKIAENHRFLPRNDRKM